jgi:signal transduction histidine kinase
MANSQRTQLLTNALRSAAIQAAELAGGGAALIFAGIPGAAGEATTARLHSAAGFPSLDDAREVATTLGAQVADCLGSRKLVMAGPPPSAGPGGAGGVRIYPLCVDDAIHGALAVSSPNPLAESACQAIELLAATTAVHIDHVRLSYEIETFRSDAMHNDQAALERSDEVLKLSEALFAQDIELLRNNEKLGQIEKVKSDFIEKMSRELRTPLNSIIESTISVLAGDNDNLSDSAKESLRRALDEGTIYQRTLQNILDLWRIKQGEMEIAIQDLNFSEVVDEAIFSVQDSLGAKPVEIEKALMEPFPKIKSDVARVNQILFLLLDNAVKFTEQGRIRIVAGIRGDDLCCEIHDTGVGICSDDQEYIYDEFFQVDDRQSMRYRGAGLGLSLVRGILNLLGGSCQIRSEAGQGTTASFEIPIQLS